MENYRKSFICNNRVKKISSEPDAVIKRVTSGSRGTGPDPWTKVFEFEKRCRKCQQNSNLKENTTLLPSFYYFRVALKNKYKYSKMKRKGRSKYSKKGSESTNLDKKQSILATLA